MGIVMILSAFVSVMNPPLTEDEKKGLLLMSEEEKLAFEVYTKMFEKWDHHVFSNIKETEAFHGELVKGLIDKYKLQYPDISTFGKYNNSTLQKLYNDLIEKGNRSLPDAFEAGATIEDIDIADLDKLIVSTKNTDLKEVYEKLNLGSRNHLRAFNKQLNQNNRPYVPQYISQVRFDDIINTDHENCNDNIKSNCKKDNEKCCKGDQKGKSCNKKQNKKACARNDIGMSHKNNQGNKDSGNTCKKS
jgi:hypothetical protein